MIHLDPFGAFHCHSFTSMSSENRGRRGQMASNTARSTSAQLPETRHPPSDGAHANIFTGALAMAVLSNSRNSRQKSQKNSGTSWGNMGQPSPTDSAAAYPVGPSKSYGSLKTSRGPSQGSQGSQGQGGLAQLDGI